MKAKTKHFVVNSFLSVFGMYFFQFHLHPQPGPGTCHIIIKDVAGDTIPFHKYFNRIYVKGGAYNLSKKMIDGKVYGSDGLINNASIIPRYFNKLMIIVGLKRMKIELMNQPHYANELNLNIQFQPGNYQFDFEKWSFENQPNSSGFIQIKPENLVKI